MKKYIWLSIIATTILVWYFNYLAWTTEYDENANNLVYGILTSILTWILLVYLEKNEEQISTFRKIANHIAIIFGTPIAYFILFLYAITLKMNYVSSTYSYVYNQKYNCDKFQNLFKAKNIFIKDNLTNEPDTIICEVNRDGKIKELYFLKKGQKISIRESELNNLTKKQKQELTTY